MYSPCQRPGCKSPQNYNEIIYKFVSNRTVWLKKKANTNVEHVRQTLNRKKKK